MAAQASEIVERGGPALASRDAFAESQAEMTRTWYGNLLKSGRNVEDYVARRQAAYLDRWREAGRYFGRGGRLIDIGGGNLYPDLLAYFRSMGWDYWYADIGESEVAASARLAQSQGFNAAQFSRRLNHELTYDEASFDAVFSSHCIEHSMDLPLTLRQLNRILRVGGNLAISVPFGWDAQPNHPYFLMENEWLTLVEDAGFRVRAYQIGDEYPETGQDLMIAAEKTGPAADRFRLDIARYTKTQFRFVSFRDPSIRLHGSRVEKDDHVILDGDDWRIEMTLEAGVSEALPVFIRHSWSGVVGLTSAGASVSADLFRPRAAIEPLRLRLAAPASAGQLVEARPLGRSDISFASQAVLVGLMTR